MPISTNSQTKVRNQINIGQKKVATESQKYNQHCTICYKKAKKKKLKRIR